MSKEQIDSSMRSVEEIAEVAQEILTHAMEALHAHPVEIIISALRLAHESLEITTQTPMRFPEELMPTIEEITGESPRCAREGCGKIATLGLDYCSDCCPF